MFKRIRSHLNTDCWQWLRSLTLVWFMAISERLVLNVAPVPKLRPINGVTVALSNRVIIWAFLLMSTYLFYRIWDGLTRLDLLSDCHQVIYVTSILLYRLILLTTLSFEQKTEVITHYSRKMAMRWLHPCRLSKSYNLKCLLFQDKRHVS